MGRRRGENFALASTIVCCGASANLRSEGAAAPERAGPQTRLLPHNLHQFNISILNTLAARGIAEHSAKV